MIEIQDILNQHMSEYYQNHKLSMMQHKVVNAISSCRTQSLADTWKLDPL